MAMSIDYSYDEAGNLIDVEYPERPEQFIPLYRTRHYLAAVNPDEQCRRDCRGRRTFRMTFREGYMQRLQDERLQSS